MNKAAIRLAALTLAYAAPVAQAKPSRFIAAYSENDVSYSETIKLGSDGKYTQTETRHRDLVPTRHRDLTHPRRTEPVSVLVSPPVYLLPSKFKRTGRWVLRDKPGGVPVSIPADGVLPEGAVVELDKAMPFGLSWENQEPQFLQTDRTLDAGSFQPVKADK